MVRKKRGGVPQKRPNLERPRLCVHRSLNHIYAQVIDDVGSQTVASASSVEAVGGNKRQKTEIAAAVGSLIAQRSIEKGVVQVVFDRRGYKYHGRVKALAEAARAGGLKF
jgi:large subunit ribosomal protein L18